MSISKERRVRRGLGLTGAGLLLQLGALVYWTPITFVVAVSLGVPLVLAGGALFLSVVWRDLKEKGAV